MTTTTFGGTDRPVFGRVALVLGRIAAVYEFAVTMAGHRDDRPETLARVLEEEARRLKL